MKLPQRSTTTQSEVVHHSCLQRHMAGDTPTEFRQGMRRNESVKNMKQDGSVT